MEQLVEKSERAKRREEKIVQGLREEIEEMRDLMDKEREEKTSMMASARKVEEIARKLEASRNENDRLTKRVMSSERRLEQALMENVESRQEAKKNERTLQTAVHLSAELLKRQRHQKEEKRVVEEDETKEVNEDIHVNECGLYTQMYPM